jgi:hypothetical protein
MDRRMLSVLNRIWTPIWMAILFFGVSGFAQEPLKTPGAAENCGHLKLELFRACQEYLHQESKQPCGEKGYFLRFGFPYCQSFLEEVRPELTPQGAIWLDQASQCLRAELNEIPRDLNCDEVERRAIASHAECYTSTGFCHLVFQDKFKVFRHVRGELKDPRFAVQLFKVLQACAAQEPSEL